jgi:RHS repeat-associated protein
VRRLLEAVITLIFVLTSLTAAAQETGKFRPSGANEGLPGRYRVTLALQPGDELEVVSSRLAAMYALRLEPYAEQGFTGFAMTATETRARLLSADPRVAVVEEMSSPTATAPAAEPVAASATIAAEATRPRLQIATDAIPGFGTYAYDGSGNITSIGDGTSADTFIYDRLGRLERSALRGELCTPVTGEPCYTQKFTYDRYGNIRTIITAGDTIVKTIGVDEATNQIDNTAIGANVIGEYDERGNVKSYNSGTFAYDGLDAMTASLVDGTQRIYVYSASDERVVTIRKTGSTTISEWSIRDSAGRVLRRFDRSATGAFTWAEDYIYRDGQLLAAAVPGREKVRHFYLDHLGTPRLITGNGGALIAQPQYLPFGQQGSFATVAGEKSQFTGHERDASTLDYMHARYYDPYMGRFLSVDPAMDLKKTLPNPQMWNRYAYVMNNPMRYTDPTGREADPGEWSPSGRSSALDPYVEGYVRFVWSALHVEDLRSAFSGLGSAPASEKLMAGTIGIIALADIASNALAPEKGAAGKGGAVMLGHFPEYLEAGARAGARTFNVPTAIWNKMDDAARWGANQKFLDRAIQRGASLLLATDPSKIKAGSFLAREVKYLQGLGYKLVKDGDVWKFVR